MSGPAAPRPELFPDGALADAGLNRCHIFTVDAQPDDIRRQLGAEAGETRLILLGHAGRRLWDCVQAGGIAGDHPIDTYTLATVDRVFREKMPERRWRALYPAAAEAERPIGLQALGALAGWHHDSPFRVGVDPHWGSWYAYRALLLCDGDFSPSVPVDRSSPCADCRDRPCIAACPAGACGEPFDLPACLGERLRPAAFCATGCLARQACPVGAEHRYDDAQIRHSYGISLAMIRRFFPGAVGRG
ncbi:MAG: hypothetical protein LWW83_07720 [Azonexaceae bacterium]|nr:hypothetical protein [Azonexaceae bacterium]